MATKMFEVTTITLAPGWAETNKYLWPKTVSQIVVQLRGTPRAEVRASHTRNSNNYFTINKGAALSLESPQADNEAVYFEGPTGRVLEILQQHGG